MIYVDLAASMVSALNAMTPLQREGIRRTITAPNVACPENAELWDAFAPGLYQDKDADDTPVANLRVALETLSLDAWRTINNVVFVLHRGNIYDERFEYLEGGGIRFEFAPRYALFFDYLRGETERLGGDPSILDVGCWQGTLVCELLQRGYAVGGTDICGEAQGAIADRLLQLKPEHRERFLGYSCGWADDVLGKMPTASWDIVVCQETLEHVPQVILQETCDQMLRVARHSVIVEVPGWDDSWPLHLRVYTIADLARLFVRDGWLMDILQEPGAGVYTTVKVVRE